MSLTGRSIMVIVLFLWTSLSWGADNTLRIRAVGDIMLGSLNPDGFLRPEEKGSILTYIRPVLQDADLTLGNLEGTLCDTGSTDKCEPDSLDCYVFRMPESYGADLDSAGFDFLSLANNHVGDFGPDCVTTTEAILDSLGIGWSGRPGTFASKILQGISVAFVAFHSGGYCNSSLEHDSANELVAWLKRTHDVVLVSVHGGSEGLAAMHMPDSVEYYLGENRGHMIKFAHGVIDAGADLVFGHGPHVARAMELYKGKVIAYSLGNFATYGRFNLQKERRFGGVLEIEVQKDGKVVAARLISVEQKYWGVPFVDPQHRFAHLVDSLSRGDRPGVGPMFGAHGDILLPN